MLEKNKCPSEKQLNDKSWSISWLRCLTFRNKINFWFYYINFLWCRFMGILLVSMVRFNMANLGMTAKIEKSNYKLYILNYFYNIICYYNVFKRAHSFLDLFYCGIVMNIWINFCFTQFLGICKPIILLRIQSVYVKGCWSHKRWTVIQVVDTSRSLVSILFLSLCTVTITPEKAQLWIVFSREIMAQKNEQG